MTRALALIALVGLAAPAAAQDAATAAAEAPRACAEGRVRTEGVCCWPGQIFRATEHLCTGAPECPDGLVEHGEACIAPVESGTRARLLAPPPSLPEPPPALAAALAPPISAWPATHEGTLSRPVRRHGEDGGLVAAAMVVFDVGWMFGLLVGMLDEAGGSCRGFRGGGSCNSWPLTLIPVGGGITAGLANFAPSGRSTYLWGFALGIPSVMLQGIGLIMLAVALANEVHDLGFSPLEDGDVTLSLVPAAQGADVGASLLIAF